MLTVSDIMQLKVVALRPESTLGEAITTLYECGISGAPVVIDDNRLVGIISELALLDVLFDPTLKGAPVADYMTKEVHSLAEGDSLTQAVHMIVLYGVQRLPVVRDGQLVGVVSRRDLLAQCSTLSEPLADPLDEMMPQLQ
jgi:tRNA nucleotidyltransferase (CCA-adding enzyme)